MISRMLLNVCKASLAIADHGSTFDREELCMNDLGARFGSVSFRSVGFADDGVSRIASNSARVVALTELPDLISVQNE